jgi:hypothetical protein
MASTSGTGWCGIPRQALALAVLAGTTLAMPRPARAATEWAEVAAISFGAVGDGVAAIGLFPLLGLGKGTTVRDPSTAALFYGLGGGAVGLGGIGVGIQAGVGCGNPSDCRAGYGMGGAAMGVGALWIGLGIYCSLAPPRAAAYARYVPVPLAIRTEHGTAPGIGVVGVGF